MANRNFARVMRRKTQWYGFGDAAGNAVVPDLTIAASGVVAIMSEGFIANAGTGLSDEEGTITRMIGTLFVQVLVDTVSVDAGYAIGCVIARDEAIAAGVASLPDPESEPDAEWLYWTSGRLINPDTLDKASNISHTKIDFDVRGQRVARKGSRPVWLVAGRTNTVEASVAGRYLVKLT